VMGIAVPLLIPMAGIVGAATASLASACAILVVQRRLISTTQDAAAAGTGLLLPLEVPPR